MHASAHGIRANPPSRREVAHEVLRLTGPVVGQSLLMTLVFLVDRVMLGWHSEASLASQQITNPMMWAVVSILGALNAGTVAVVGRAVGAGDYRGASEAARAATVAAVALGLIVGGLCLWALPSWNAFLAPTDASAGAVMAAADAYLRVVLPASPLLIGALTLASVMHASGDTRTPLLAAVLANLLNVAVNWVLIFGHLGAPELGAAGAAVGSVVAGSVEAVILFALLYRGFRGVYLSGRRAEAQGMVPFVRGDGLHAFRRITRVAMPSVGERFAQQIGHVAFVYLIAQLGAHAMAANQALLSVEAIGFLSADGFGIAAASLMARALGRKDPARARLAVTVAVGLSVGSLGTLGLVFAAFPEQLMSLFGGHAKIVAMGVPCLYVAAVAQPFMACAVTLNDALKGAGATRTAFAVMVIGGLFVRLSVSYFAAFTLGLGLFGIWIGSTVDWAVRTVLLSIAFRRGRWAHVVV